jgi:hypothetical protein
MTSATMDKSVHRLAVKRPPAVPGGAVAARPAAPTAAAGALLDETEELGKRYDTVLCCTLDTESK